MFYEAPTSDAIPANVAQEVYNRLEPVLTNWVSLRVEARWPLDVYSVAVLGLNELLHVILGIESD